MLAKAVCLHKQRLKLRLILHFISLWDFYSDFPRWIIINKCITITPRGKVDISCRVHKWKHWSMLLMNSLHVFVHANMNMYNWHFETFAEPGRRLKNLQPFCSCPLAPPPPLYLLTSPWKLKKKKWNPVSGVFVCIHFVGGTSVEGKLHLHDLGLGFSQAIATATTSSFAYKAHYSDQGTLFPTIQVSRSVFKIFLHDSETDVLLMNTFLWTPTTIIYLWAALHYSLLLTKTTASSEDFKCGYSGLSDEFGGLTRLEGRTKFAVPIASISHDPKCVNNVLVRSVGGKRKHAS